MTFKEYQTKSRQTAQYQVVGYNFIYPALGLAGESGEVLEKIKKLVRNKNGQHDEADREAISAELGDVLWYIAQLATEFDLNLDQVAEKNITKLFSRLERGVIKGAGDQR